MFFRDYLALNVYVAMCYYKLDYYDVSQVWLAIIPHYHNFPSFKTPKNAVILNLNKMVNKQMVQAKFQTVKNLIRLPLL